MPGPADRYRAIHEIIALTSSPGELSQTLRKVLASARRALPVDSVGLWLPGPGGRDFLSSGGRRGQTSAPSLPVNHDLIVRELGGGRSSALSLPADDGRAKRSFWVVPVSLNAAVLGAILCPEDGLAQDDKDFLAAVSQHLSFYLFRERSADGLTSEPAQKRIQEVSAIYEISQAMDSVQVDNLLKLTTEKAAAVMDAQACSLMLKDPHKDELVIKASYGLSEEIVEETRVAYGEGVAGRVAKTGQPMLLTNLQDDPRFVDTNVVPRPDIISSICVPLRDEEGRVQGVLSIRRRSPAAMFNEDDVKLFSVFASQAALAISNAHLYKSLKQRLQELSTLYETSNELSEAYSLENAATVLVRLATQMIDGVSAMLLLLDSRPEATCRVWASSVPARLRKAVAGTIDHKAVAWMHQRREPQGLLLGAKNRWPVCLKPLAQVLEKSFSRVELVPLVAEDSVIGILMLGSKDGKRPEKRRIRLLSIIASQAATVIKNASKYEEEMGQKVLELSALYELSERISTARNLKEAFDSILDIVRDIVWYDESFIYTVDYERDVLTVQACRSVDSDRVPGSEFALSEDDLSSWAIRERKALVSRDIREDPRFRSASGGRGKAVRSLMAIPLIVQDEVVGVLSVHSYAPNMYTEENVKILSVIASQAAALYKELEALSALASYTDNILRSIAAGVLTLDKDGRVLAWNKAAEDTVGISASETVGEHFSDVVARIDISESDKERILAAISKVLETGERYLGYKLEYHPVEGEIVCVNMSISLLRDHVGEVLGLVIIFEDVTKEIKMENEMRRISELAAIGQLAASIAHELRNPLSSIKGAAQYIRKEYEDHAAVREFLDIIIEEVNVLNKVTTEFLDFARPTKFNLRETDINDVLFRTLQFMQVDITKQGVQVEQELAYDAPRIIADDKQLEQVFRNMVLNALQAMPDGGTLAVSTCGLPDGVSVTVADTGTGIPEEKLDQIFEPFFTTKTKGTGLGLAIVKKIIENHGGKIAVKSQVGRGTAFEIFVPLCSDSAQFALLQAESAAQRGEAELLERGRMGAGSQ